jgi:multiple sugar transport system permease protein
MDARVRKRDNLAALPLVAPFVLVYALLFVWPSIQMLVLSFTDSGLIKVGQWVGGDNYVRLIGDRRFWVAVLNTLYFVGMTVVPGTLIGLGLAMLVSRLKGPWQAVALAVFFVPYILPVTTVTSIAWWFTDPKIGPLGGINHGATGDRVAVWQNVRAFLPGVAVLTIWWSVGFNVLIFLAGLRALPHELFEAARLDGAGRWSAFRYLTWPLLWPVTIVVLTIQLIVQIKVFDQVFLMVSGGRTDPTMVLVQYIYTVTFQGDRGGYGATVAVALFALVLIVSALQFQLLRLRSAR